MGRLKGSKHTIEARAKISKNNACYWSGKKVSEETKKKIGDANRGRIISKETRIKLSLVHKGERAYNYIKDRTKLKIDREKAYDTRYKYWMLEVKKRDGWKCKISNGDCKGHLEAHHILNWKDHPELRYEVNNGITLCQAHHPRKRVEEAKLSPFFQKLVAEMK